MSGTVLNTRYAQNSLARQVRSCDFLFVCPVDEVMRNQGDREACQVAKLGLSPYDLPQKPVTLL